MVRERTKDLLKPKVEHCLKVVPYIAMYLLPRPPRQAFHWDDVLKGSLGSLSLDTIPLGKTAAKTSKTMSDEERLKLVEGSAREDRELRRSYSNDLVDLWASLKGLCRRQVENGQDDSFWPVVHRVLGAAKARDESGDLGPSYQLLTLLKKLHDKAGTWEPKLDNDTPFVTLAREYEHVFRAGSWPAVFSSTLAIAVEFLCQFRHRFPTPIEDITHLPDGFVAWYKTYYRLARHLSHLLPDPTHGAVEYNAGWTSRQQLLETLVGIIKREAQERRLDRRPTFESAWDPQTHPVQAMKQLLDEQPTKSARHRSESWRAYERK